MSSCIDGLHLHPENVHDAAVVLDALTARFIDSGDPRAAFSDVYGIVTHAVAEQVRKRDGMFLEPAWITRLAGRFCERYLETLRFCEEGLPQDCGAWHVAYAASRHALPVQNALLGFSAHINYDLAFGIHATIVDFGHANDGRVLARYKHDHDQVNTILYRSVAEAVERLASRHGCKVSAFFRDNAFATARWAVMQILTAWRERVWSDVRSLLAAETADARATTQRKIDRHAHRLAHLLALPAVHPTPRRPSLTAVPRAA